MPSTVIVSFVTTRRQSGISGAEFGLESLAFHLVLWMTVLDALFLINVRDYRQQRVVLAQDECMVEIADHIPSHFLNLVAWINHVYAPFDGVFHLDCQNTSMSVEVLSLTLETIETMCILNVKFRDTSLIVIYLMINTLFTVAR